MATLKKLVIATNTAGFFLSHRLHLASAAKSNGFEVIVLAPPSPLQNEIQSMGFRFVPIELSRKGINPFKEIQTVLQFKKLFQKIKPDVLHAFTIKPVVYGLLATYLQDIPKKIVTITGLGYLFINQSLKGKLLRWIAGLLYRLALRKADKVIFQNQDDQKLFIEKGWVKTDNSLVIPGTGVDTEKFSPKPAPKEPCTFVFPARFLSDKGIYELMMATEILHQKELNFKVRLCGKLDPGNPASLTQHELNDFLEKPEVQLVGFVKDMSKEFLQGRVAVLPSYREGLSLALIEAASSGLMIITTDAPGCRDVVENEKNGILVPVGHAQKLAEAMEKAIENLALRLSMGQASRAKALESFEKAKVTGMNLAIY